MFVEHFIVTNYMIKRCKDIRPGMANLFKGRVKFNVVDRKKKNRGLRM